CSDDLMLCSDIDVLR
ncbi:hypothetical protein A2U01_0076483, partial [Trifolium medium]|nr:hypothetical protein [Trifolium medium]